MDNVFNADFVYPLDDGAIFEDTLEMLSIKNGYDSPLKNPITDIESLSNLIMPCPYKDGRMPTNIKAYELISQKFDKPLAVSVPGPFTIAAELAGVTHIARSIIRNPGFVNGLVDFTTRMVSNYSKAITKHGVRLICISEPTGIILSPKKFEELISSNLRKVFVNLDTDAWKVLHVCGDSTHLLQQHQLLFFLCFFP